MYINVYIYIYIYRYIYIYIYSLLEIGLHSNILLISSSKQHFFK